MNNTAEMTLTEFKRECPEAYQSCRQTAFERLVCDPEVLWRAVSVQGMTYQFLKIYDAPSPVEAMNAADNFQAAQMARAIIQGDHCDLGRMIADQVKQYLEEDVEAWVDKKWREWA